jgi:hypothetical protein
MAEDARTPPLDSPAADAEPGSTAALEPGAPVPPDAIDPELLKLSVPLPRRHPLVAVAVLLVGALLLYRMRTDLTYAMQPAAPRELGEAAAALRSGKLAEAAGGYVRVSGLPDRRNALAFDPKGSRLRTQVFRILGTGGAASKVLVATPGVAAQLADNHFTGRLRRFDEVYFADAVADYFKQTQALRALDLGRLKALPAGPLPQPLATTDRSGEPLQVGKDQELLIDVLFADDLRVLLSKDKFPSEPDARREIERVGLPHGPGIETKDGFGYVLRLPPHGLARQRVLAQIDGLGIWLWHRIETYRVPLGALSVTPAGLVLPGPDALAQPVRYQLTAAPPPPAGEAPPGAGAADAAAGTAPTAGAEPPAAAPPGTQQLAPQKEQTTVLLWEQVQAVQVSEPLTVPADAWLILDGESPRSALWTLPVSALLALFMAFNVWYLLRSLGKSAAT